MLVRRAIGSAIAGAIVVLGSAGAAGAASYPPAPPPPDVVPPIPGVVCGESGAPTNTVMVTVGSTPKAVTIKPGDRVVISADASSPTSVTIDPPEADPVSFTLDPGSARTITVGPCSYTDSGSYTVQTGGAAPVEVRVLAATSAAGLASTGASLERVVGIGAVLLGLGLSLIALTVRRRAGSAA